jgi:hypothetical protein
MAVGKLHSQVTNAFNFASVPDCSGGFSPSSPIESRTILKIRSFERANLYDAPDDLVELAGHRAPTSNNPFDHQSFLVFPFQVMTDLNFVIRLAIALSFCSGLRCEVGKIYFSICWRSFFGAPVSGLLLTELDL